MGTVIQVVNQVIQVMNQVIQVDNQVVASSFRSSYIWGFA